MDEKKPLSLSEYFGVESFSRLLEDYGTILRQTGSKFQLDLTSLKHLRPLLSVPAYLGFSSGDGLSAVINLFDRVGGGENYSQRVSRHRCLDFRGGYLTYDDHDGSDFTCTPGSPVSSAADGKVVLARRRWLRGGLTLTVNHGSGVLTQYTHLARQLVPIGTMVRAGEVIALSGSSGVDMTTFFPWVPPHVHFMSWVHGVPIDPYRAQSEKEAPGTWENRNDPQPVEKISGKAARYDAALQPENIRLALRHCRDPRIAGELAQVSGNEEAQAALLEDSFHHDRDAWPEEIRTLKVHVHEGSGEKLHLPFPASLFRGSRLADSPVLGLFRGE